MNTETTMDRMMPGEIASVADVAGNGNMSRRFLDLGLIRGTKVECVGQSPFGDPVAYLIRGAVIAIRRKDSASVRVQLQTRES